MPKVSIIIPNYNHQPFLQQRLDSVFNQSFQDFEVILLDDASTDGSQVLLKNYESHPKVSHLVINEENSGSPFKQWQKGIALAQGDYIWIAESDDSNDLSFLEYCTSIMSHNNGVGLVATGLQEKTDSETLLFQPFETGLYNGRSFLRSYMLKGNSLKNGSSVLFKSKCLTNEDLDDLINFRICGDWWLWVHILKNHDFYFIKQGLTTYRKHESSVTYKLRDNIGFYKESLYVLNAVLSLKLIHKDTFDSIVLFWINKVKSSAITAEVKRELTHRFSLLYSAERKVKLKTYKFKNKLKRIYAYLKRQYHTKLGLDRDLYLVYTLSKVGSSSVYYSLKEKYPYKEIHHLHFLGDTWLRKFETGHEVFNNNLRNAKRFFALYNSRKWNLKIICLTRDPVARDISGIFQTHEHIFQAKEITDVSLKQILEYLHEETFSYSENWFQTDFKEFVGVDIFEKPFDKQKGYTIYKTTKAPVLIMQLERLNDVYNEALTAFIGGKKHKLIHENITADKSSGLLNRQVKEQFKMSREKAEAIYSSKYVTAFYTLEQIQRFKSKWTQK